MGLSDKKNKNTLSSLFKKVANSMNSKKEDNSTNIKSKKILQDININKIKKVLVSKTNKKIKHVISDRKLNKKTKIKVKKVLNRKIKKKLEKKIEKKDSIDKKENKVKLKKVTHNPIIAPSSYGWESKATFNPAAFEHEGKVYIIYRAMGEDDSSVLGYACSHDGLVISERPTYYIYKRINNFTKTGQPLEYSSGGGFNGGCEDPRIALIDGVLYMIYTAFDGWGSVRVALTSISLKDFKSKKWNWKKEVMISKADGVYKNWVIFPEKINGKFAIMHSISPDILIDYFDSLNEFDGKNFIDSIHQNHPKWQLREKGVRGVGPSPIKIDIGWLILYHRTEEHDPGRYKIFAMILDKNDPTKVLYKSQNPLLEPDLWYENDYKPGIVYTNGAIIKDGLLIIYYGGGDKYVCAASIKLDELISSLKEDKIIKLKNTKDIIK